MCDYRDPRLSILNVAQKSGIVILRQVSNEEFMARCPFCGDSEKNPKHGHLMLNIEKDAYHCTRCGEKGFAIGLYARLHRINNSEAFKELMNMIPETIPKIETKKMPQSPIACINERDKVYRAFLDKLTLKGEHLQNLIRRGLSWEETGRNLYKSVPTIPQERLRICQELLQEGLNLKGIPGFFQVQQKDQTYWDFYSDNGFFIPVRDIQGRIQGMQIRLDDDLDRKYVWFSSKGKLSGTPAHAWIGVHGVPSKTVLVTEGPLKADIAHFLSRFTFVSVAGVDAIKGIEQVLKELGAKRVFIAYDMDLKSNKNVQKAKERLEKKLIQAGFEVHTKTWDERYKGIDDYLVVWKKRQKIV
ncbi:MAG: primase [Thermosipho sp. (in: thermotogales)]|nr:primase [Thermosipho sp. (in: thermotogales)]